MWEEQLAVSDASAGGRRVQGNHGFALGCAGKRMNREKKKPLEIRFVISMKDNPNLEGERAEEEPQITSLPERRRGFGK